MASIYRVYGQEFNGQRVIVAKDNGEVKVFLADSYEAEAIQQAVGFFEPVKVNRYMSMTDFKKYYGGIFAKVEDMIE